MGKPLQLGGQRFGRLLVIGPASSDGKNRTWKCKCDCGGTKTVPAGYLSSGDVKSCGCMAIENRKSLHRTHGEASLKYRTKEYSAWSAMKGRCYNTLSSSYAYYGARGIKVCERWMESFQNFISDMGRCPAGCSLERRDVNGDYSPKNCRWATRVEQMNNRRNNVIHTFNGESMTIAQWSAKIGIEFQTLWARLNKGWSIERALTTPLRKRCQNQ